MSAGPARYRIVRPLVRGGYAEVFEALVLGELGFTRRVALKKLRPERAEDPDTVREFIEEAKLVSQLHHANIVGVLDVGTLDGVPFQVMELVEGHDLRALVEQSRAQGRRLTPEVALHVAIEVAHALDHAHRAVGPHGRPLGIVHRDVSPENVLVSTSGDVKLADFGIAKQEDQGPRTQVGVAKGKPSFMAPEQHLSMRVDARTDLFALGLLLHFLIVGRSPLEDEAARREVVAGGPVPLDPSIPPDVAEFLGRASATRPDQRFDGAAAFLRDAARLLAQRGWIDGRSELRRELKALRTETPTPRDLHPLEQMWMMDVMLAAPGSGIPSYTSIIGPRFAEEPDLRSPLDVVDPSTVARTELAMPMPGSRKPKLSLPPPLPEEEADEVATVVPLGSRGRKTSEGPPPLPSRPKLADGVVRVGRAGGSGPGVAGLGGGLPVSVSVESAAILSRVPLAPENSVPPMPRVSSRQPTPSQDQSSASSSASVIVDTQVSRFGLALATLVAAVFLVAGGAVWWRAALAPREEIALAPVNEAPELPPPPAVSAEPPPAEVAVVPAADESPSPAPAQSPGEPPRKSVLRGEVRTSPRGSTPAAPSRAPELAQEQRRLLDRALDERHLRWTDVEELPATRALFARWKSSTTRADESELSQTFAPLQAAIEELVLDGAVLEMRLARIRRRLESAADTLPSDVMSALERRYLDARTRVGSGGLGTRDLSTLGGTLSTLEADVLEAQRAAR